MIKMSEEQKTDLFNSVKAIVEELNPANVEVLKDLIMEAIKKRIDDKEKAALATVDSRMKMLENQFKEELTTLKKEITTAVDIINKIKESTIKALELAKKGAIDEAVQEISKIVDLVGGPEQLKTILEAIPDFKDPLSKLWAAFTSKKYTTRQLLVAMAAIGSIATLIQQLLVQLGIIG